MPFTSAAPDWHTLAAIAATYRRALDTARVDAAALARTLTHLDGAALMAACDAQFGAEGAVRDCFTDAFHDARCELKDAGAEPILKHAAE